MTNRAQGLNKAAYRKTRGRSRSRCRLGRQAKNGLAAPPAPLRAGGCFACGTVGFGGEAHSEADAGLDGLAAAPAAFGARGCLTDGAGGLDGAADGRADRLCADEGAEEPEGGGEREDADDGLHLERIKVSFDFGWEFEIG